jgi:polyferredoxin
MEQQIMSISEIIILEILYATLAGRLRAGYLCPVVREQDG